MSTRSRIAVKLNDNEFKSVYCHHDGYLSWNGRILLNHYNTKEKALALIELGDLSSLHESIECPEGHSFIKPVEGYTVAYGRDRGETGCNAVTDCSVNELLKTGNDSDAEYIYLFDVKENKWYWWASNYHGKQWFELTEESVKKSK
jgi:hypothetical protein